MDWLSIFVVLLFLVSMLYLCGTWTYNYWEKLGIIYDKPKFPFLGNTYESAFSLISQHDCILELYNKHRANKFVGTFLFTKPTLLIIDPDLIEAVLVKDFNTFYNRATKQNFDVNPLTRNLFLLKDSIWKNLRNKLAPIFTSAKLKGMLQQLMDCSDNLLNLIKKHEDKSIDLKDILERFSMDVIGSCAFGLNIDELNNPQSQFRKLSQKLFEGSFKAKLRIAIRDVCPEIYSWFKWKQLTPELEEFFKNTIKQTLEYRENNKIERHDFLHLLNELKKQEEKNDENSLKFDENWMAANAFIFFTAGFHTSASTMSFALYEMSLHPDIQEKAFQDVINATKKFNGLTFEAIKEMRYLDCVIKETLRRYSPAAELTRESNNPYTIPGTDIVLPKGTRLSIPIYAIHHDPKYYPEPYQFKPERFSEGKVRTGTYLPFGDGPRICIGMRFAGTEIKVALSRILLEYELLPSKKTQRPLKYVKKTRLLTPVGGVWADFKKRH